MKKNNLADALKTSSKDYRLWLANVAIASGNLLVLDAVKQVDPEIVNSKDSPLWRDEENIRNICKLSSPEIADAYERVSGKAIRDYQDARKNSCLHLAAKHGNMEMIKHLLFVKSDDPNRLNARRATPLHSVLRSGGHKHVETALFLAKYTDLSIKDDRDMEPHRIRLKNTESNARLSSILEKEYLNFIKKDIDPMRNL